MPPKAELQPKPSSDVTPPKAERHPDAALSTHAPVEAERTTDDESATQAGRIPAARTPPRTAHPGRSAPGTANEVDSAAARLGPLLAVCGLCGGAGASTLAYLVAASAAQPGSRPVLACDADEHTAGLSAYAGAESQRSLSEIAAELGAGEPVSDGLFAEPAPGLRLIGAAPRARVRARGTQGAVARLLTDARTTHSLTVVDCGQLAQPAANHALEQATHVAWLLPAIASGVLRARRALGLHPGDPGRRELVVARFDPGGRKPPTDELGELAASRRAPLVLMPNVPDLGERPASEGVEAASLTLDAIHSLLRR